MVAYRPKADTSISSRDKQSDERDVDMTFYTIAVAPSPHGTVVRQSKNRHKAVF